MPSPKETGYGKGTQRRFQTGCRDAVRIALTSGLTRRQVASDLGIGLSTLGKWIGSISDAAKAPEHGADLLRENERLRKENRILREERAVLKNDSVLCGSKAVKFQFIASYRGSLSRSQPRVVQAIQNVLPQPGERPAPQLPADR